MATPPKSTAELRGQAERRALTAAMVVASDPKASASARMRAAKLLATAGEKAATSPDGSEGGAAVAGAAARPQRGRKPKVPDHEERLAEAVRLVGLGMSVAAAAAQALIDTPAVYRELRARRAAGGGAGVGPGARGPLKLPELSTGPIDGLKMLEDEIREEQRQIAALREQERASGVLLAETGKHVERVTMLLKQRQTLLPPDPPKDEAERWSRLAEQCIDRIRGALDEDADEDAA